MRTAIVYASVHHGNTEKLAKRIAEECQVDLIDAVIQPDADLSSYDMIWVCIRNLFFKVSSVDIGICREESTERQKDISDLYLWWKCEL